MKKFILLPILFLILSNAFSQQVLYEQDAKSSTFQNLKKAYPVVNEKTGELILFQWNGKAIKGHAFDKDFKLAKTFSVASKQTKSEMLGSTFKDNKYHFLFKKGKKQKTHFFLKSVDIQSGEVYETQLHIPFKKEVTPKSLIVHHQIFLDAISYKNKIYLLVLKGRSSLLKIYVLEGDKIVQAKILDFAKYKFDNPSQQQLAAEFRFITPSDRDFSAAIKKGIGTYKIVNDDINFLDLTTNPSKIYCHNDKLIFTLDNETTNTKILSIDLNNFSYHIKLYPQAEIACSKILKKASASYLNKDVLYQIIASKEEMCFTIYDLIDDTLLAEYRVGQDEDIDFKNTIYTEEKRLRMKHYPGLKIRGQDTKDILKRMAGASRKRGGQKVFGTASISAYQTADTLVITLGTCVQSLMTSAGKAGRRLPYSGNGSTRFTPAGEMIMTAPAFPGSKKITGLAYHPSYHYNSTMAAYAAYKQPQAGYFKSLLDPQTFEHVEGEPRENAFDKIVEFSSSVTSLYLPKTVFRMNGHYVLAYYDAKAGKFYLRKFED